MARCNPREQCARIPHPIMLLFVVSAIFIITGLNRRGMSFLFAGTFAFLLAIIGWVWYKKNGNKFNIKFLDQLSGAHAQGEMDPDVELEMRYMNNAVEMNSDLHRRNIVLMHNPMGPPLVPARPMVPPPYSSVAEGGPGQLPPYTPNPDTPLPCPGPANINSVNSGSGGGETPAPSLLPSQGTPPVEPPSYDSLYPTVPTPVDITSPPGENTQEQTQQTTVEHQGTPPNDVTTSETQSSLGGDTATEPTVTTPLRESERGCHDNVASTAV